MTPNADAVPIDLGMISARTNDPPGPSRLAVPNRATSN